MTGAACRPSGWRSRSGGEGLVSGVLPRTADLSALVFLQPASDRVVYCPTRRLKATGTCRFSTSLGPIAWIATCSAAAFRRGANLSQGDRHAHRQPPDLCSRPMPSRFRRRWPSTTPQTSSAACGSACLTTVVRSTSARRFAGAIRRCRSRSTSAREARRPGRRLRRPCGRAGPRQLARSARFVR